MKRVALAVAACIVCSAASNAPSAFDWRLPQGVQPPPVPADNPMSDTKVELGRRLFYDADLSIDGTTACATCHEQHRGFTEGNATHPGVREARGRRNVMALANVAYFVPLTWARPDLTRLEDQVRVPVLGEHPVEMGMAGQEKTIADRLSADPCYRQMFAAAFPEERGLIALDTVAKAIAAFERTLLSFDSPYDRYKRRSGAALSDSAMRGEALFDGDRLHCASCHAGASFTDLKYHALGLSGPDRGLGEETHDPADDGKFRTPSLRNVALTGPYMHDGTVKDLTDAVRHHFASGEMPGDAALSDLAEFLRTLTDTSFVSDPRFALPKTACGRKL